MNILLLTDSLDMGGAETHVITLATDLKKLGHSLTVCSGGGRLASKLCKINVKHICLPLGSHALRDIIICRLSLSALLKKEKFDVVHSHARLASLLVSDIAQRLGVLCVCTAHAHFKITALRRFMSRWGDVTIAVSEDLKQYLVEEYRLAPENIYVIPNGADTSLFYPEAADKARMRIAFLSRLDGDCSLGAHLLCRIAPLLCRQYSKLEIIIGGGGSELPLIRSLAAKANAKIGRDAVICCGEVRDVPQFLRSCDILVGVSRAAIEGGLCGASVVLCGNEGFFGELRENNFHNALATNFCARESAAPSAERLYHALADMLDRPIDERQASAERVRQLLKQNCSSAQCAKRTEHIYCDRQKHASQRRGYTLLCGYYGYANMGDDALLRSSIERARREYGNSIVALTKNGKADRKTFGVVCAKRSSVLSVLMGIALCRRIIFGGGTLLQTNTSKRSFLYYASLLLIAKVFRRDRILWANGIGEIDGGLCQAVFKKALSGCRYIELRDRRSQRLLKKLLPEAKSYLAEDLAKIRRSSTCSQARAEYLLGRVGIKQGSRFAIAIPKARSDTSDVKRLYLNLRRLCREGNEILIIPMYERQDLRLCRSLRDLLGAKLMRGICFDDLCAIAARSECVYSMRYHGLIAAHLAKAPFVAASGDCRLLDYCKESLLK